MADLIKKQASDYSSVNQLEGASSSKDMTGMYSQVAQQQQSDASASGSSTTATEDYYQMAKDQEYGLLFDKEIQLENARANAQKYTRNSLNAQGFGSTGYGSTMQSGIYNQYMNQLANAQNEYNTNVSNIGLQQKQAGEESANDRFQSVTTMLGQASSKEQMDSLLEDYGYMKDGEFVKDKPEGMSDDDWYQIKYYYGLYKDELGETSEGMLGELSNMEYLTGNNTVSTMGKDFRYEIEFLNYQTSNGEVEDGSYVVVKNASGDQVYLKYENGKYVMASYDDSVKNSDKKAYLLEHKSGKNNWTKIR